MTRTYRVWFCPCCHLYMRRKRGEDWGWYCVTCSLESVSGFGHKTYNNCRHRRLKARVNRFNERMESRVRTQRQRAYRPSAAVKAAWREVRRARTRPAIARRGEKWVALMLAETTDATEKDHWTRRISPRTGQVHKHRTNWTVPVTVTIDPLDSLTMGTYRAGILHGNPRIRLRAGMTTFETRDTLVHEALHLLDHRASLEDHGHDRRWRARLAQMLKWFPPDEL